MKLVITGPGRHGKDTASQYLSDKYNLSFVSSSEFVLHAAVWPHMSHLYETPQQCFNDRHNHRSTWYDLICQYNTPDLSRLARSLFSQHDIYCGLRNIAEFQAAKDQSLFHLSIWIDASKRLPPEPSSSLTIKPSDCDIIITNNSTIPCFYKKLAEFYEPFNSRNFQ